MVELKGKMVYVDEKIYQRYKDKIKKEGRIISADLNEYMKQRVKEK